MKTRDGRVPGNNQTSFVAGQDLDLLEYLLSRVIPRVIPLTRPRIAGKLAGDGPLASRSLGRGAGGRPPNVAQP